MANPNGNPENLIPNSHRSPDEVRKNGSIGGKKSVEVRRQKKLLSEAYAKMLADQHSIVIEGKEEKITGLQLIERVNLKILQKEDSTSVQLQRLMLEATEGTKFEIESTVETTDLTEGMTVEQKRKRVEEILARRLG